MKKLLLIFTAILLSLSLLSCSQKQSNLPDDASKTSTPTSISPQNKQTASVPSSKIAVNKNANEAGKVMILMYHQFSEVEKNEWTRSFDNFYKDLERLYNKGYRPISLSDYINNNIDLPAGLSPIIFTFDDGTNGQFNLIRQNGKLVANPKSAVGVWEKFNKLHPEFALKGTFFINQTGFFQGAGTTKERLRYLVDKGFTIGNHTVSHINLGKASSAEKVQEEIGGNANKTAKMLPGYVVDQLALPLGITSKKFSKYVEQGSYNGISYKNKVILLVGSNPAPSPLDKNLDLLKLPRVRAIGKETVLFDMDYWLKYFDKHPSEKYVSDGDIVKK